MFKRLNHACGIPFAVIWLLASIAMAVFMWSSLDAEQGALDDHPRITSASTALEPALDVVVEGRIAEETPVLAHGMAVGAMQEWESSGDSSDWRDKEMFSQDFDLVLADGSAVRITGYTGAPRGVHSTTYDPEDEDRRWVGYAPGAALTVIGTVQAVEPPTVAVRFDFGGTAAEYQAFLGPIKWILGGGMCFFISIGFVLLFASLRGVVLGR